MMALVSVCVVVPFLPMDFLMIMNSNYPMQNTNYWFVIDTIQATTPSHALSKSNLFLSGSRSRVYFILWILISVWKLKLESYFNLGSQFSFFLFAFISGLKRKIREEIFKWNNVSNEFHLEIFLKYKSFARYFECICINFVSIFRASFKRCCSEKMPFFVIK